jgi:hypothetical protein
LKPRLKGKSKKRPELERRRKDWKQMKTSGRNGSRSKGRTRYRAARMPLGVYLMLRSRNLLPERK